MSLSNSASISQVLRHICDTNGLRYFSNDSIYEALEALALSRSTPVPIPTGGTSHTFNVQEVINELIDEVSERMEAVLQSLVIDTARDHNAKETARRYARMLIMETFKGRYEEAPAITEFPNVGKIDEMYCVGPITMRSTCAHHHVPITGRVWVGVMPNEKLIGLSKFHRVVDHIASRPQIQEEMTTQIADALEELTEPLGIAVWVKGVHMCCSHRGIKDPDSAMTTSVMRGAFRDNPSLKMEFLQAVNLSKE